MMGSQQVEALAGRYERLKASRGNWESHWNEIARYVIPRRASFTETRSPGEQLRNRLYDGTAPWALEQFAAGLHGALITPDRPWFVLRFADAASGKESHEGEKWLDQVGDRLTALFNSPASGFSSALYEAWLDLGAFGNALIFTEASDKAPHLRFRHVSLSGAVFAEGKEGRVDSVFRAFALPAREVVARWKSASRQAQDGARTRPDEPVRILHAVLPEGENYVSVYLEQGTRILLEQTGLRQMPYLVGRWVRGDGETYARSPAMVALPDIRMVNDMAASVIMAAQKAVNPPLMVPDDGYVLPIRTYPSAILYRRPGAEPIQPLVAGGEVRIGLEMLERTRESILRAFNVELFRLASSPQMTATEVLYRREERLRLLGPVVGRLQAELLGPLIDRAFAVLQRAGALPDPPGEIAGRNFRIEYVSPLAQAQKTAGAQPIQAALQAAGGLAQMDQGILDHLNFDEAARRLVELSGAPAAILRAPREVQGMREQRAAQQQQQQQMMMAQQAAQAVQAGGAGAASLARAAGDAGLLAPPGEAGPPGEGGNDVSA